MSIEINLYSISDDPRKLSKTLGTATTATCELIMPTDLYAPQIRISASLFTVNINYAYIASFSRYYYITDVTYDNGGAVILTLRCDVLMSNLTAISALKVNVVRQEQTGLTNVVDSDLTITPNKEIETILCDVSPFNIRSSDVDHNFVLVVAGGEQGGS